MAEIKSIDDLLGMELKIPKYQRPYKWQIHNIQELLNDISSAITDAKKYQGFKYRIGTIILHKNDGENGGIYDIVDGQQRIISLVLLKMCLGLEPDDFSCLILEEEFNNKITQMNIRNNYNFIREWFSLNQNAEEFNEAFSDILEVVVICVDEISEAFQLFDSQNTRGKELAPHDLLKAYHLREMKDYQYEMERAVTKWEAKETSEIHELFDLYLFPIWNWSRGNKSKTFTAKEIDTYKGISEFLPYTYAKRTSKAMPVFQIAEPFIAGNDFFEMVDHYLYLLQNVKTEIAKNKAFKEALKLEEGSVGFKYTKNLFYCALLYYYDKFHNFDEMAVKKIFIWAFMLRVDMERLGFSSINKYAIGEDENRYTNKIAMFSKINLARMHNEISGLQIKVRSNKRKPDNWDKLYQKLNEFIEG